jgi:hypothetical protein
MKRNTGIWIDRKKVLIMHISDDYREFKEWNSDISTRERFDGEGKEYGRFGDQYIDPEKKKQAREAGSISQLFERLAVELRSSERVLIIGPADMKNKFNDYLKEKGPNKNMQLEVEVADQMTNNQFKARIRTSFIN